MGRARPKDAVQSVAAPERLTLSDFNRRMFTVHFVNGVKYPGGEVKQLAKVFATIDTLEETVP